uniref:Uncharacterized protein n=1 Tax=Brassica campestris TaxID=3711 RepID=M4EG89_BRACM
MGKNKSPRREFPPPLGENPTPSLRETPPVSSDLVAPPSVSVETIKSAGPLASDLPAPVSPRVSESGSDLESSAVKTSVTVEISTTPGLSDEELRGQPHPRLFCFRNLALENLLLKI